MKKTRFDSLIPRCFTQFTKSQMKMCTCKDCENAKLYHQGKSGWNKLNADEIWAQIKELEEWIKKKPKHHKQMRMKKGQLAELKGEMRD